ncbi:MAG: hypothetical protein A3D16_08440 [Rhodobacterales bacterium RIFCSPHIGHO2_02_FULL_62_130]|jgi:uncharacterized membrane protein|nr:MAG: hypothetical protein A3D16_08440 [Rhodobacterales bacterium RIFCSPHIGHO2_02_FULL_62_130]OHC60911.1 MAG: hypothetical protein A3E48_14565 [Rhodobacterales bacterium RIFCSPHIGHO2_12_FULL_62_75]HCY99260.1 DUF599 domain-containing protein [Rhodobacter sp.]
METLIRLSPFGLPDAAALGVVLAVWLLIGWFIEHPPKNRPSVSLLMQDYRREWMRQFVTRQPRIFDATMIDNLRQGTAFFASASMIAIGGGIALIGNPAVVLGIARDLTLPTDATGMQLRVLLVVAFLSNALLKFIWAHRLFGYCAILMAAVPNDPEDPLASHRAAQAAEINITAAKSFNRGLRSIYFALGSLAWLLGPAALCVAAVLTGSVLIRREFASASREIILRDV